MLAEIRPALGRDIEQLRSIHQELNRPRRDLYDSGEFIIAWLNGIAVGCAATNLGQSSAYFYGLAVRRNWQRQGLGGQLMQARLDALRRTEADYAISLVMFWNSRFFRKYGFIPVKREEMPKSAEHFLDLTNPVFRKSAVMLRSMR
jgi:N-acetylglutamate synthase-like GNAT family acetyltransferase